jgi:dTDP-4-dehydrorhamnose 3,5-epimerase-like enzyme
VRAWQGHKREKKWFYCNSGAFIVNLIKIDNFETPSKNLLAHQFELSVDSPKVLEISGGYATGFRSLEENSHLMVFSNFTLEESKADDFRFSLETWKANW